MCMQQVYIAKFERAHFAQLIIFVHQYPYNFSHIPYSHIIVQLIFQQQLQPRVNLHMVGFQMCCVRKCKRQYFSQIATYFCVLFQQLQLAISLYNYSYMAIAIAILRYISEQKDQLQLQPRATYRAAGCYFHLMSMTNFSWMSSPGALHVGSWLQLI